MQTTSLTALAQQHLDAARLAGSGRSAVTVYGGREHDLRQTLIAMKAGTVLAEHEAPGEATLQVIEGQVTLRADTDEGPVSVAGTLVGKRDAERVMQVDDFDIEMAPAEHMIFFTYADRPGIIGKVGTILGGHGVNIATMDVGRKDERGEALMCLTVDAPVPPHVLAHIATEIEASRLRAITLPT